MCRVEAIEAKNKLGQLLDLVEQGEEVTITRHGREVARIVPVRPRMTGKRRAPPSSVFGNARKRQSWAASTGRNGRLFATKAVELAQRRGVSLATLDGDMRGAGAKLGLSVLGA